MATATPDMPVAATGVYVATSDWSSKCFLICKLLVQFFVWNVYRCCLQSGRYKKVLLIGADKMSSSRLYRSIYLYYLVMVQVQYYLNHYEGLGYKMNI
jgi:3-oxoacyl-[acyl-carrier-protein] synthase-3